jgi:hypothetical protein
MELMQASHQWRSRPDDERFISLGDMKEHFDRIRAESRQMVSTTRRIEARPAGEDNDGMELLVDKLDEPVNPTHHAFGQLAHPRNQARPDAKRSGFTWPQRQSVSTVLIARDKRSRVSPSPLRSASRNGVGMTTLPPHSQVSVRASTLLSALGHSDGAAAGGGSMSKGSAMVSLPACQRS